MRRKAEPARAEALWDEESFIAELKPQLLRVPLPPEWITDTRLRQLYRYTSAVEQWNRRINLVGQMNRDFLALHLLDSLAALPVLFRRPFQTAVDIGSGAGLPGIPLAVFTPDCRWTLVERSAKRAGFLRTVAVELGLQQQVEVRETQAEFVTETFDLVVFRAFSPVSRVFPLLKQRVAAGGRLVAYKGKAAAVFAETEALKEPLLSVVPLTVPLLKQERHLLIYEPAASLLK